MQCSRGPASSPFDGRGVLVAVAAHAEGKATRILNGRNNFIAYMTPNLCKRTLRIHCCFNRKSPYFWAVLGSTVSVCGISPLEGHTGREPVCRCAAVPFPVGGTTPKLGGLYENKTTKGIRRTLRINYNGQTKAALMTRRLG